MRIVNSLLAAASSLLAVLAAYAADIGTIGRVVDLPCGGQAPGRGIDADNRLLPRAEVAKPRPASGVEDRTRSGAGR